MPPRASPLLLGALPAALGLENGQGGTPPLGFNPWTAFRANLDQAKMLEVAHALVDSGLRDAGYVYVNLDCGWTTGYRENATGRLQVDTRKFPNMTDYARQLHAMGLKFGMYAGGWGAQCCHRGGGGHNDTSWQHWDADAQQFKEWGVDYLKSDPCCGHIAGAADIFNEYNVQWAAAFRRIGYLDRVFYQGSGPGRATNLTRLPSLLNSWRTTGDVRPEFASVVHNIEQNDQYAALAGPHHWNDADMLQCGQPGMTLAECRLMLSLWSLAKSPMLIGADVRQFNDSVVRLLGNPEVLAVNQDPLGLQGRLVVRNESAQVWVGALSNGFATALVNLNATSAQTVTLSWDLLPGGVEASTPFAVRDLWAREDLGTHTGAISFSIGPQDSRMLRLSPLS